MTDISLDIREFLEFITNVNARADPIIRQEGEKWLITSSQLVEGQVASRTPVNLGHLQDSFTHEITKLRNKMTAEVFSPLHYGLPVEKGRKAGRWPPQDAIRAWVIQKGIAAPGKDADAAAFLIARAIGKGTTEGIMKKGEGAKMMEKGFEASEPSMKRSYEDAVQRIVIRLSKET